MTQGNQQGKHPAPPARSDLPSAELPQSEPAKGASSGCRSSIRKRIRVRREDSAFVYNILESHEGITAYSTLPHQTGELHRDLELFIPPDFLEEVKEVLKSLGDLVYELDEHV